MVQKENTLIKKKPFIHWTCIHNFLNSKEIINL